jgi:alcohol dehydrogenase (cytochrome c)
MNRPYSGAICGFVLLATVGLHPASTGPGQTELNGAAGNTRDWLLPNHDYAGTRFVDLDLINRRNAASMRPICIHQTAHAGSFQSHPIVYDGVLYVTAGPSTMAIDAATCELRWRHDARPAAAGGGGTNRGVAIKDGRLVRGAPDGRLIALDAGSGKVLWDVKAGESDRGESFPMPPLLFEDLVIVGPAGAERGIRGWIGAFRLADGAPLWKFYTIPHTGEAGAETWSEPGSPLVGGGATWTPFTLDPARRTVYAAISNPAPDFFGEGRKGDNLFTNSVVALDARTGKRQWHYQVTPHDLHDWDLTHASPWFTTVVDGRRRDVIAAAGKEGLLTLVDRDTHQRLWDVAVTTRENIDAPVTVEGVHACPGVLGGVQWNGPAYNPPLDMLYTPAVDWCGTFRRAAEFAGGRRFMGGTYAGDPFAKARGWLTAVDASTGRVKWKYESKHPMLAAVTTTSGGLLFTGELTGDFLVFDAQDGSVLHRFRTGAPNNGGVATYALDGKQYVALVSGDTSGLWPTPPAAGNVIIFGL